MNDDAYAEWLVKRKDPIYAVPVKILMAVLCLVSLLIAMQTAFGAILLIAGWNCRLLCVYQPER